MSIPRCYMGRVGAVRPCPLHPAQVGEAMKPSRWWHGVRPPAITGLLRWCNSEDGILYYRRLCAHYIHEARRHAKRAREAEAWKAEVEMAFFASQPTPMKVLLAITRAAMEQRGDEFVFRDTDGTVALTAKVKL